MWRSLSLNLLILKLAVFQPPFLPSNGKHLKSPMENEETFSSVLMASIFKSSKRKLVFRKKKRFSTFYSNSLLFFLISPIFMISFHFPSRYLDFFLKFNFQLTKCSFF